MLEKYSKVDNPLTIIAIFAGITEVASSVALPFLSANIQETFVWFLILFPFALITAFFLTLNFNTKSLYAPADYRDDKHFLQALSISEKTPQISVKGPDEAPKIIEALEAAAAPTNNGTALFAGLTKKELKAANGSFDAFSGKARRLFDTGSIESYSVGIHGESLFLLNVSLRGDKGPSTVARIIRPTTVDGKVMLHVIGKGITSSDPEQFAGALLASVEAEIAQIKRGDRRRKEPNKAPEPTPTADTPDADASVAPSAGAAHL